MATRLNTRQATKVKEHIQTTQLVKRLQDYGFSKVELTASQVTAILGLLRKTIPDLKAMEHSAGDGASVGVQFVIKQ